MRAILCFKHLDEDQADQCSCGDDLREVLINYHGELVKRIKGMCLSDGKYESEDGLSKLLTRQLKNIVKMVKSSGEETKSQGKGGPRPEGRLNLESFKVLNIYKT